VGLSRSVLERRFLQYLGRTPKAEIIRIQIERAKMLLSRTDKNLDRIAQNSGFTASEYFSRAFRREVGMTANAYRRMRRIARDLGAE
jgi:LacI family transcriptional regulator